jgi:acyl-CoA thioesterase
MVAPSSKSAGPCARRPGEEASGECHNEEIAEAMRLEITPEKEEAIRKRLIDSNNYPRLLGFVLDSLEQGRAVLSVEVSEQLLQQQRIMHGGAIASLIDTAVALAIAGISEPGDRFTTVEMKVNYLTPIKAGRAIADARLIKNGRRIVVGDCDVSDSQGRLAAKGLVTYIRI